MTPEYKRFIRGELKWLVRHDPLRFLGALSVAAVAMAGYALDRLRRQT